MEWTVISINENGHRKVLGKYLSRRIAAQELKTLHTHGPIIRIQKEHVYIVTA